MPIMTCGGILFWVVRLVPQGVIRPQMGGALIQLHPGWEHKYLSRDHNSSTNIGWQERCLYIPNEWPSLQSYSSKRLHGDTAESWESMPTLLESRHVPKMP